MTTAEATRVIDVRRLPHGYFCGTILDAFDSLAPGQSIVVVGGHPPRDLLRRLQDERKGLFEWSPLEADRSLFRTEVTRRAAQRGDGRQVAEALAWDHDRLDALEGSAFDLFALGDASGARARWREFSVGLRRHIRFEEEILFPTFEERLGISGEDGPTGVMRAEHREIERVVEAIARALEGQGAPLPLRAELKEVLGQHNLKEERVLYPGTDQCLDPVERDALVARIQAS